VTLLCKSALCAALTILVASAAPSAAAERDDDANAPAASTEQSLRQALLGAWTLAGETESTGEPPAAARLKFWGLGHWVITQSDPNTGQLIFHHGGTYTLEGDNYAETIAFAARSTEYLIGRTFKYKIKVDGDTYTQIGVGNEFNERWVRLKTK
jgi:hypothetical protein